MANWQSPTMTNNSTPSPYVVSANSEYSATYAAFRAFDGSGVNYWQTAADQADGAWIKMDTGSSLYAVNVFSLFPYIHYGAAQFKFQGSNNDSDWVDLYSGTAADSYSAELFMCDNTTKYRYYRILRVTGYNARYIAIIEIVLYDLNGSTKILPTIGNSQIQVAR